MLPLAEYQRRMVAAILREPPEPRTTIHRDTVFGGLVNALQLTFPTVVKLTGADFFGQTATGYAREHPPRSPVLHSYGEGFPDYLHCVEGARALPYLRDVARFDLALDRAAHQAAAFNTTPIAIHTHLEVRLASSLTGLQVSYPVDLIRDALDAQSPQRLADLDMTPRARHYAIWRGPAGSTIKLLSPAAAAFLNTLLDGRTAEEALQRATEHESPAQALAAIETELLRASFAQLTWHSQTGQST